MGNLRAAVVVRAGLGGLALGLIAAVILGPGPKTMFSVIPYTLAGIVLGGIGGAIASFLSGSNGGSE